MKNLKSIILTSVVWLSAQGWLSATTPAPQQADNDYMPRLMIYIIFGMAFALCAWAYFHLYRSFNSLLKYNEHLLAKSQGIVTEDAPFKQESLWSSLMKSLTKATPIEKEADVMLDHNYDGIKELDNSLPPWWVYMFYITIVWSVVYMIHFHVAEIPGMSFLMGKSQGQAGMYQDEMAVGEEQKAYYMRLQADKINENTVTASTKPEELANGKTLFTTYCVSCHGKLGEGGIGPNLTDNHWLHGTGIKNVFKVVTNGVPEKGMISWKDQLRASEIRDVSSYILTLKGTNPPNGKVPQGEQVTE